MSGIVRVLCDLSVFANAVSQGNFSQNINIREGGEIGSMVSAMRQIPSVLEMVISGATDLPNKILSGYFRDRFDSSSFQGEYAVLAQSVNNVGDAYTGVIDSLPVPMIFYNQKMERLFINKIGNDEVGDTPQP